MATAACSSKEFDKGFKVLVREIMPNSKLEQIPLDDPIYKAPFDLTKIKVEGTKQYQSTYNEKWAPLYGIRREGRWILVYSPVDFCSDLSEKLHETVVGYKYKDAARLSLNILNYSMLP